MKLVKDENNTDELIERIEKMRGTKMRFGILGSADGEVLLYASVHEFGAPSINIPERSFMRKTFDDKIDDMSDTIEDLVGQYIMGDISYKATMDAIGEYVVGLIRQTVVELKSPPLKSSTIAAKGSSQPLIDKGQMLDSIDYEVV